MMLEGFLPEAVGAIRARLDTVRKDGMRIGFAIESGSRAWGFPSPDSDYDCRFVYVRPVADHICLQPLRDVIEFPITTQLDTGGWDLRKALLLALKGNAVIVEWVQSPLVYEEEPGFRPELKEVLAQIVDPAKVMRHYFGLLQWHKPKSAAEPVILKKLLYAVRPAVSLEWMRQRNFGSLPPMNLRKMLEQTQLNDAVRGAIETLIAAKLVTREMGEGQTPQAIFDFLKAADNLYRTSPRPPSTIPEKDAEVIAAAYYRYQVAKSV